MEELEASAAFLFLCGQVSVKGGGAVIQLEAAQNFNEQNKNLVNNGGFFEL